jgi:hypothetical protein
MSDGDPPDDDKVVNIKDAKRTKRKTTDDGPKPLTADERRALVVRFNQRWAFIEANEAHVLELTWINEIDGGRTRFVRIEHLSNLYADQRANVGTAEKPKMVTLDKIWFTSDGRATYRNIGYWGPKETVPAGHLNLWSGFAIEPREGEWKQLEWFLLNIASSGDAKIYERLLKAIAWKFQNPTLAPEVAIVMLGPQGTGKGTFAHMFELTFGRGHYLQITEVAQATALYNGYMLGRFVMFFDEVFFGHDPRAKGKIKGMTTEPTILIHPKYVNPFPVRNAILFLYASNETAALPIDIDDRRDTVLRFSTRHKDDKVYFAGLRKAMKDGEMNAFLHHCLQMDLTEYENERRQPILTAARNELAIITSNPAHAFLLELLEGMRVTGFRQPNNQDNDHKRHFSWLDDDVWIRWDELHEHYRRYVKREHGAKTPMSKKELLAVFRNVLMTHDDTIKWFESESIWLRGRKKSDRVFRFPSRKIARQRWEQFTQSTVDWPGRRIRRRRPRPVKLSRITCIFVAHHLTTCSASRNFCEDDLPAASTG